jgi:hypothetical protein
MDADEGWQTVQTVVVTVKPGGMEPQDGVGPTQVSVMVVVMGMSPVEQTVVYTVVYTVVCVGSADRVHSGQVVWKMVEVIVSVILSQDSKTSTVVYDGPV